MRNFHDTFGTRKRSIISAFSICITVPLILSIQYVLFYSNVKQSANFCNFIKKETLAQVFSCEFCEISKNTFFAEHLWATGFGQ